MKPFALPTALAIALCLGAGAAAQSDPKPQPERKGIQYAEPVAEEKGAVTNLGTDVDAVRDRIETALRNDPSLSGTAFTINVTDDTVEISGVANTARERTAARRIVQSYSGNLRVKDRITIAGAAPLAEPELPQSDQPQGKDKNQLRTPEADEPPAKKANKPKREPAKHGDKAASEDPRDPRKQ